jgi:threonine synthase
VPTGNFGDVLAGFYAKKLGLPMEKLVVATNANDILARFWKTGRYEKAASDGTEEEHEAGNVQTEVVGGSSDGAQATAALPGGGVAETLSPAMDILVSSNFERLLFYLALEGTTDDAVAAEGEIDTKAAKVRMAGANVAGWMGQLKTKGRVVVPHAAVEIARRDMIAERVSDEQVRLIPLRHLPSFRTDDLEQTTETIQQYFKSSNTFGSYVADPHTAVGLNVANRIASDK